MALDPALVVVACGTCPYFQARDEQQGECHERPPTVTLLIQPSPIVGQSPVIRTQSMWPPVKVGESCGKHPMFMAKQSVPIDHRLVGEAEGTG